ncbi:DUF397 domain-containing protein [Streptomyces niger]|uniref:DUF397 domain-containing protein n=1 Tax=Streptomyces niger TaxID=66373 RepID=UPI00069A1EAE|nr:DUF397 domain-containing protein [Streptomyces niger]
MTSRIVWFKSSHSGTSGGDCVEVAVVPGTDTVHIRDSKRIRGAELRVSYASWADFLAHAVTARSD